MESSPIIRIPTTQGDYELHWGNTLVRLFSEESFNHIEHYTEEDKIVGMRVGQAVLDIFLSMILAIVMINTQMKRLWSGL